MVTDGVPTTVTRHITPTSPGRGPGLVITGATVVHPSSAGRNRILTEAYNELAVASLGRQGCDDAGARLRRVRPARAPRAGMAGRRQRRPAHGALAAALAARRLPAARNEPVRHRHGRGGVRPLGAQPAVRPVSTASTSTAPTATWSRSSCRPATNRRTDAYGGTPRSACASCSRSSTRSGGNAATTLGLSVRLSADEEIADGLEIPDTVRDRESARDARRRRPAQPDARHAGRVRQGHVRRRMRRRPMRRSPSGASAGCRSCSGSASPTRTSPSDCSSEDTADLIGMVRAFLADPEWLTKVRRGEATRIRPAST